MNLSMFLLYKHYISFNCIVNRHRPIMPKILPIMLLSIAQKLSLLCSKLCFQNQDYALELTVLLEYINLYGIVLVHIIHNTALNITKHLQVAGYRILKIAKT